MTTTTTKCTGVAYGLRDFQIAYLKGMNTAASLNAHNFPMLLPAIE
jgi:hypothetical protein